MRPRRRGLFFQPAGPFAPRPVPLVLKEANALFMNGEYAKAAELFESISTAAFERGGPRAPKFLIQAGRARIYAGQADAGMKLIFRGLEVLKQQGRLLELERICTRVCADFSARQFNDQAVEIDRWLGKNFPERPPRSEIGATDHRRVMLLPTQCPSCGAAVHPEEVEWVDEFTAECSYCGNLLRKEEL
jgi:hypothetical protein